MDLEAEEGATKDVGSSKNSKCTYVRSLRSDKANVTDSIHALLTRQ